MPQTTISYREPIFDVAALGDDAADTKTQWGVLGANLDHYPLLFL